ncbi:MAG: 30S ribosomal protein S4 [Patescibacteria group bacterium]
MNHGCRKCRREGEKLMLKGERCLSPKCAVVKRPYVPGQHGPTSRIKLSEYGKQLREKQKIRKVYGISESQLKIYYENADRKTGNTAENLVSLLESRLDNVLFRSGIVNSHATARQLASHGRVYVNNKRATSPSIIVKPNDVVKYPKTLEIVKNTKNAAPNWISLDDAKKEILVKHIPERVEIELNINENLIVEFYSR